jgi:hypothetical protein
MGGHLNAIGVRSALRAAIKRRGVDPALADPWYFPTPAAYSKLLQEASLTPTIAYLFPRPTPLGKGPSTMGSWLEVSCISF